MGKAHADVEAGEIILTTGTHSHPAANQWASGVIAASRTTKTIRARQTQLPNIEGVMPDMREAQKRIAVVTEAVRKICPTVRAATFKHEPLKNEP